MGLGPASAQVSGRGQRDSRGDFRMTMRLESYGNLIKRSGMKMD
jgi:hypothetical protein